jgi:hypothetical protein
MKPFLLLVFALINSGAVLAQNNISGNIESIDKISRETQRISKSLDSLNEKMKIFTETFSANQGLKLTERQQRLLAAFEYLNRAEQRLATLQLLRINLLEKQSAIRAKLAEIEDGLRPESIDRSIVTRGTTNAEELRSIRRQMLNRERAELNSVAVEIQNTISETNTEIRQTENFLRGIRLRLFPEIEKDLSEL